MGSGFFVTGVCGSVEGGGCRGGVPVQEGGCWIGHAGRGRQRPDRGRQRERQAGRKGESLAQ